MCPTYCSCSTNPCSACGGTLFDVLFSAMDFDSGTKPFELTKCTSCQIVRTEPITNDTELEEYYDLSYYADGKKKFVNFAEAFTRFSNYLRAHSILTCLNRTREDQKNSIHKILDVGCGRGTLLKILKNMGHQCYGVEKTTFPSHGPGSDIHFYSGQLEDINFPENFFDIVAIWHVLEHASNPAQMIQEAVRIMRQDGLLAVAVPNFGSFQAKLFKENWFHLDLPRHRYHFTRDTLFRLLRKNGFLVVRQHTFSIEQNPFGFIQSFFNKTVPSRPNRFYSLLKKSKDHFSVLSLILWAVFTVFILPFVLLEYFISGLFGKGATLIVYAKKC